MPTTRVVFENFEGDGLSTANLVKKYSVKLNWKFQGGGDRVIGSNQRTILREVWISFWNHTM